MTTTQTVTHISPALQHTASHAAFHIKIRKKDINIFTCNSRYFTVLLAFIDDSTK